MPNTHSMSRNVMVRFNGNRMRIPLPANTRHIREVLDEYDFDILHVQAPYSPFMAGRVLDHAHQRTGIVATYHIASADLASRIGGRALGLVNMHSHRRVDGVIAVSQIAAQYAEQTAHVRGVVIPNPVDVDRFAGASPPMPLCRAARPVHTRLRTPRGVPWQIRSEERRGIAPGCH